MPDVVSGDAALAVRDALLWHDLVAKQWERAQAAEDMYDQQGELYLLAIAIRNVVRAADAAVKIARQLGDRAGADELAGAIKTFTDTVPHGKNVRDILEHFDEYRAGEGRLQRVRQMDNDLLEWVEDHGTGPVLVLGAKYRLDGAVAVAAAGRLASAVFRTFHGDGNKAPEAD